MAAFVEGHRLSVAVQIRHGLVTVLITVGVETALPSCVVAPQVICRRVAKIDK